MKLSRFFAGWLTVGFVSACGASTPGPTAPDVAVYTAEQINCIEDSDARVTTDLCRGQSRAQWCLRFPAADNCVDGGVR